MNYKYKGAVSGVTLKIDENTERDIIFHDGVGYNDLPEKHAYIKTLVARGHLIPVGKKQATKDSNTNKGEKNNAS